MAGPILAERVMKARKASRCALDACPIHIGDRIGLLAGIGWCAINCIITRNLNERTSP